MSLKICHCTGCVVFLGKTFLSVTVPLSIQLSIYNSACEKILVKRWSSTCKLNMLASNQGVVVILLVAYCYRN